MKISTKMTSTVLAAALVSGFGFAYAQSSMDSSTPNGSSATSQMDNSSQQPVQTPYSNSGSTTLNGNNNDMSTNNAASPSTDLSGVPGERTAQADRN